MSDAGGAAAAAAAAQSSRPAAGTEVYTWGRGDCGQLGSDAAQDSAAPTAIDSLHGRDIVNAAVGALHAAVVTADGELYVFGSSDAGQLGLRHAGEALVLAPRRVTSLEQFKVEQVAAGPAHTLALLEGGAVASWGDNEHGETGQGGSTGMQVELPRVVKELRSMHVVRVAAGGSHTLALSSTGGVFSCGSGLHGQLGRDTSKGTDVPRPISRLWPLGVVQVACGDSHSAALTADGRLFAWGFGRYGALGLHDFESRSTPQLVRSLAGAAPGRQVACGENHTVLLAEDGSVFAWGQGKWGQTGLAHTDNTCVPSRVAALQGRRVMQVAAGARHTLALAADNSLWAWGAADSGQLSTPAGAPQPTPQQVQGLPAGSPVRFVAAGGDTSLAVVNRAASAAPGSVGPCDSRRHGEQWRPVALPDLLQLTAVAAAQKGSGSRAALDAVVAAVEQLFASPGYLLALLGGPSTQRRQQQRQQQAEQQQQQAGAGGEAEPMDSSPHGPAPTAGAAPAAVQGQQQAGEQQQPQQQQPEGRTPAGAQPPAGGLDAERVGEVYQALLKLYDAEVVAALGATCVRLLDVLERFLNSLSQQQEYAAAAAAGSQQAAAGQQRQDLGWVAPLLFVLLQNPLNGELASNGSKLLQRICRVVAVTLPAQERLPVRHALRALLARLPADVLAARCIRPVQRYIDACVQQGLDAMRVQVLGAGVLLDVLRQANEEAGGIVPFTEFCSRSLSEGANLQAEYVLWRQNSDSTALCSLCQMPYLLTPEAKSRILHGEAAMEQQQHLSAAATQALFQGVPPSSVAFLSIQVRRSHVVEDALNQLVHRAGDLKKPLRVQFISGGVPEPAQDEGGVRKEFFQLLVRDLLRPDFGMFAFDEATRTHWFNAASLESEVEYALVGAVLGLAIYNDVLLDVRFPPVVFKLLLGGTPTFQDLKVAFPELGRGLQQLLEFEGDVEAVFCRSFTAEIDFYGERRTQELKPGGAGIPVTAANREEYVQLYTEWALDTCIHAQLAAFRSGFLRVCGGPALSLFTHNPPELELLVCGLPHLDFSALQRVARYEGGYSKDYPTVLAFWEVLHSLPLEQKRAFLAFTTGCDRAPVGGLAHLPLLIQRAGPDTDRLPTSHTCFNALLLPEYSSAARLREKLLTAISNAQGFGLQ